MTSPEANLQAKLSDAEAAAADERLERQASRFGVDLRASSTAILPTVKFDIKKTYKAIAALLV